MAKMIKAINAYRPRIIKGLPVKVEEVAELIGGRTSMNPGSVHQALKEFWYALLFFSKAGRSVNLPGLGTFTPSISLDGSIKIKLRVDSELISELNKLKGNFLGKVENAEYIGKTSDELVTLWNEEHPDDLVE